MPSHSGAHSTSMAPSACSWCVPLPRCAPAFVLHCRLLHYAAGALAEDIAGKQESSKESRRALTEAVKAYRGSGAAADERTVSVLKSCTDEIDALTKRARGAEKAFVALFKELVGAPDPAPLLLASKSESASLRLELSLSADQAQALRAELAAVEVELGKLRNQDITLRELTDRIAQFESAVDATVSSRLAQREAELRTVFELELEAVREAETAAEARLAAVSTALAAAEALRDEAHVALYATRGGVEIDRFAEEAEALRAENDRLSATVTALTAEMATLRATGETVATLRSQRDAYRSRCEALEAAVTVAEGEALRAANVHAETVAELTKRLEAANVEVTVAKRAAEVRVGDDGRALSELKSALSTLAEEGAATGGGGTGDAAELHHVVLRRVKALEGRALVAEAEAETARAECATLRETVAVATHRSAELAQRVAELEDGIAARFTHVAPATPVAHRATVSSSTLLTPVAQLSAILGQEVPPPVSPPSAPTSTGAEDGRLLSALAAQRDRFRSRVAELESDVQRLQAQLVEVAGVHADNVKLYEKVRYLQSFLNAGATDVELGLNLNPAAGGPRERRGKGGGETSFSLRGEDDFEGRYKKAYDAALDPFSDFNRREKARSVQRLSATERITLSASQAFLANKYTRQFVFFYVIVLHLLVFATLWHFVHVTHDDDCGGGSSTLSSQARLSAAFVRAVNAAADAEAAAAGGV